MQFALLHVIFSPTQADNTASLQPGCIKADTITLSHSCVCRGKPAGVGLLVTAPKC